MRTTGVRMAHALWSRDGEIMSYGRMTVEIAGRTYSGIWRVEQGTLTVSASAGSKQRPLGAYTRSPSGLARVLLRELVAERADQT
jgi:hypothetical protein